MRSVFSAPAVVASGLAILSAVAAPQPTQINVDRSWLVQKLPADEVAGLEAVLEQNPDNVLTRIRLMCAYVANADNARRARHLLWLINHHPETPGLPTSLFVYSSEGPLQDLPTYHRVAELWRQQASQRSSDPRVVINAAAFLHGYYRSQDPVQAEQWLLRARELDQDRLAWTRQLAMDYMRAIAWGSRGSEVEGAYAAHAREALRSSTDRDLLWFTGDLLAHSVRDPDAALIAAVKQYGEGLMKRAEELGFRPPTRPIPTGSGSKALARALDPVHRVDPEYPAAVAQAKLRGIMRLHIWIAASGEVKRAEVVTGHPLMKEPARNAVLQWKYPPQDADTELDVEVPFGPHPLE